MNVNQLELFVLETKEEPYEGKTKVCSQCGEEKPATLGFFHKNMNDKGIYDRLKHICIDCVKLNGRVIRDLKKKAPPVPENCDCCGIDLTNMSSKDIHFDHCKVTETFRGWLCKNCNVGLGMLGDDLAGIHRALVYLNKHKDKIDG